ncbi:MAG: hypothetical protein IJ196_00995 [Prevotella sp.]|nr:hypothetical protein [Prevotella sp.]
MRQTEALTSAPTGNSARLLTCKHCGTTQDERHFALLPSRNRRRICNHCRYVLTIRPSRVRRWIRELEAGHGDDSF